MNPPDPDRFPKTSRLRAAAGMPLVEAMVQALGGPLAGRHTLLAVCPNSEAVTRAALHAAREADAPLLYAATLNQVDRDGGYTGWTPEALAAYLREQIDRLVLDAPVVLCLDHGGPWKKDVHVLEGLDYEATMAEVKQSFEACIDAGYELLHVDPTEDHRLPPGAPVPTAAIAERTAELMAHAEAYRARHDAPALAYEVGTEEVGGGLQTERRVGQFIDQLADVLDAQNLPHPCFVVADVGTTLDSAHFDPVRAKRLTAQAERLGALLKGHYTDDVDNLEAYPLAGMGGANVGPGFSAAEYAALIDLVKLERQLGKRSGFAQALRRAVVESGRWQKWKHPQEADLDFDELAAARQAWLVETGSRYVWTHPAVVEARARLYTNVDGHRDADAFVIWRIKQEVLRYYHAFHLIHFNDRLVEALSVLH